MNPHVCRACGASLRRVFCDLGSAPLSNAFRRADQLDSAEVFYPLCAFVCETCFLVQLPQYHRPADIFSDYAYFSSYSDSWLEHARRYAESMIERFAIDKSKTVIEIASNDGYLLRHFAARRIPVLGIEPAANVAEIAIADGIQTLVSFFGHTLACELIAAGRHADLLVANNVLAHVPDLNDFVSGLAILLAADGVLTLEFPHLLRLMQGNQFDTIYHEHFSYFSLLTVERVLRLHGLKVFAVEELPTHGGSLRIFAARADAIHPVEPSVEQLLAIERTAGLGAPATYDRFASQVRGTKRALLRFLIAAREEGKRVVGYGAPAKGNTLLNYCGVRSDLLDFTVDRNPHKQGTFLPGTRIAVRPVDALREARPDYVLLLPWNLREELAEQLAFVREWGGRLVVPIPAVEILA